MQLTAYCLKTKTKDVPMLDIVVSKTKRNSWLAQGHDGLGNKMSRIISENLKQSLVETGVAKEA